MSKYLYNGMELPDIYSIYTPELQKSYPYAVIVSNTFMGQYWLYISSEPVVGEFLYGKFRQAVYTIKSTAWSGLDAENDLGGERGEIGYAEWANHDILDEDGTLYLAASEPVPVYGYLTFSSPEAFTLSISNATKNWDGTLYYSTNMTDWTEWDGTTTLTSGEANTLYLRGIGNSIITGDYIEVSKQWILTGSNITCSGNIENLLDCETVANGESPTMATYCFAFMFYNNTNLIQAPELPSTTLATYCYDHMFSACTSLTQAPELPATTLVNSCYYDMFISCTSLTQAPELPATTLASNCYRGMFYDCTSLTQAPELPATTIAGRCYQSMFSGCTSLTQAPELPATTLDDYCYYSMFNGCTSLTEAPDLPAKVAKYDCYKSMFDGCTSLVQAPELPATTLATSCYEYMFHDCTSLTEAPALPATKLAQSCYKSMFDGCTSLIQAPELPATTLATYCYYNMFWYCTSLIYPPELPATNLSVVGCYSGMFFGCSSIKLSTTQVNEYQIPYCIPVDSDGTVSDGYSPVTHMFSLTGGTFKGTPEINTTYYLADPSLVKHINLRSWLTGFALGLAGKSLPYSTLDGVAVSEGTAVSGDVTLVADWEVVSIPAPVIDPLSMWLGWKAGNTVARQRSRKKQLVSYLYNDIDLPALPERDKETYPYAYIGKNAIRSDYELFYSDRVYYPIHVNGNAIFASTGVTTPPIRFVLSDGDWLESTVGSHTIQILWSNTDVYYSSDVEEVGGTLYLTASDPIPVYE